MRPFSAISALFQALVFAASQSPHVPVNRSTPRGKSLRPTPKRSRQRRLSYGDMLQAHFDARNLTPARKQRHEQYLHDQETKRQRHALGL